MGVARAPEGECVMTEQPSHPDQAEDAQEGPNSGADPARPQGGRTDAETAVDDDLGSQGTPSA